ncbi:SirA family protein [Thiohalorhabdus denitrificans]|uniref:tRNA 2-thiouridine synthesizing protein A n=1 Tax=Thiohalorhabdus denitrificans TaxID=381306 RepID=A0A0P9C8Q2_9GAMM|nr:sulfurtransferase TusA family protein [Thiohalorhabdus denitrificans]KPV39561.1 SirA family protein [Thiohalorhabdus denitrificans]SCX98603.1 tRNA 2-thiouridine synthesizing protein A [Thiohalorhabdus denitrificans]
MSEEKEREFLDARSLLCPMPVIRAGERIAELEPGTELEVRASDPGVLHDIPAWCRVNGHTVLEAREEGDELVVVLRVGADDDDA